MKAPRYLGLIQEKALGVQKNYKKALEYYVEGSNRSDITSSYYIGLLYEKGLGVKQDYKEALKWYLVAAPTPQIAAQNIHPRIDVLLRLGYFYEKGLGVKKDLKKALEWYKIAEQGKSEKAKEAIDRLIGFKPEKVK